MKKTRAKDLFFAAAVFVFVCLLLSGGSRLIASPEKPMQPIATSPSWMRASFTCPPEGGGSNIKEDRAQENRQYSPVPVNDGGKPLAFSLPLTDSNGNVLRRVSYMRAVYQAFALGDGFA